MGCLIIILVLVAAAVAVKWVANNDSAAKLRTLAKQEEVHQNRLIEMIVEGIVVDKIDYQPGVILKQKGGDLYLPIWVGLAEANAISVILEEVESHGSKFAEQKR